MSLYNIELELCETYVTRADINVYIASNVGSDWYGHVVGEPEYTCTWNNDGTHISDTDLDIVGLSPDSDRLIHGASVVIVTGFYEGKHGKLYTQESNREYSIWLQLDDDERKNIVFDMLDFVVILEKS